jgi:hypothetical protein
MTTKLISIWRPRKRLHCDGGSRGRARHPPRAARRGRAGLAEALGRDRPVLVDAVINRLELTMPPCHGRDGEGLLALDAESGTGRARDRSLLIVLSVTAGCTDIIGFRVVDGLFTAHIAGDLVILAAHRRPRRSADRVDAVGSGLHCDGRPDETAGGRLGIDRPRLASPPTAAAVPVARRLSRPLRRSREPDRSASFEAAPSNLPAPAH